MAYYGLPEVRDDEQPKFTRGQNLMILSFLTVPALIAVIALAVIFRHFWLWIVVAAVFSLGNLAPALRAALYRRERRRNAAGQPGTRPE